jgi:hypothetical protein
VAKPKPEIPDFGIVWPQNTPLLQRHQYCAYHDRGNGSFFHRRALIQAYWPEEVFAWHDWSDRMLRSTCDYDIATWIGAGSTSKSTTAAALGLQWWLEAPFESSLKICSTTIKMLRLRVWSEFSRLFCALPKAVQFQDQDGNVIETTKIGYVGELVDSDLMIRWRQGDNKHAIFGFGVNEGSVAEAVSNLVGIHTRRMWLMLDELQGIREAVDSAKDNMSKNAMFRVLGMGNTDENMKSLLRRAATPVNGWDSVDTTTAESWETDGGVVAEKGIALRFDGRKSPAIANPKKYPYLIGQKHIDAHLRKVGGNMNDPGLCSQCFAIWPAIGLQNTVLDSTIITKFHCHDKAVWTGGFKKGASLDPSFTEGGDKRILQFFKFGLVNDSEGERWVIEFGEWVNVPVDSTSEEPIHYQIVNYCKDACKQQGVTSDEFSLDSSGEGGGLKAIFDTEWGVVMGIEFGGNPSETPYDDKRTAKDVYDRRVSELNFNLQNFAKGNGIRGLSKEAAEQACARKTIYKNKKNTVEKKVEMKSRTGESPDNLDSCCVGVAYAMQNGARPGGEVIVSRKVQSVMSEMAREGMAMRSEEAYLVSSY